ncbi:MAG: Radical SAM domain-containing protein [Microgenomates bacterium 39_6]|nr:MAG: Radical SAM domain-containing protein [Microgenomates bacterium 39_6]
MLNYFLSKIKLRFFKKIFFLLYEAGFVPPPRFVVWDCTRKCNLNCEHCGAKKEKYSTELTTKQVKSLVRNLADYKVKYFVITGGEPLLRKDLFEIFAFAKEKGLKTGLATNGFFINADNSKIIAKIFNSVQISLDGPQETHNKIRRNKKAFQKAIESINLLQKNNCRQIAVSSVITPSNIGDLPKLSKIVKDLGIDIWKISSVMPIGNAGKNKNLYLSEKDFLEFLNFVKNNKERLKIKLGENLGFLGKYDKKARSEAFFCPVGFLTCCVGVNGNVRGCPEQPDNQYFKEGNILKKSFREIWEEGFKKYRNKEFLKDKNCQKCKFQNNCNGGCWVMKLDNINCPTRQYHLQ